VTARESGDAEAAEVEKGRWPKVESPGATPADQAMDPSMAAERTSPSPAATVGGGGVAVVGGYVVEVERNPKLKGTNKFVLYNENMRDVDSVAIGVRALTMLAGGVHWDVDPPTFAPAASSPPESKVSGPPGPAGADGNRPKAEAAGPAQKVWKRVDPPKEPRPPGTSPRRPENQVDVKSPPGQKKPAAPGAAEPGAMVPPVDPRAEKAKELAEWVEQVLFHDMQSPWWSLVRRTVMFKPTGCSIHEWTAERRADGRIGIADVENRPPATIEQWDLDRSGTLQGVGQRIPLTSEFTYIPRWKLLYVVDDELADGDPQGVGLLRHSVNKVNQLRRLESLEGIGYETDLRGIPVTRAPLAKMDALKFTDEAKEKAIKPLKDFMTKHVRDEKLAVMLDSSVHRSLDANATPSTVPEWSVDLLTGDGDSHEAIRKAIDGKQREIARTLFAEGFMLGGDGGSNRALGEEKSRFLAGYVNSVLTDACEAFNRDLVGPLWVLNGFDPELKPRIRFEEVSVEDATRVADMLEKAAKAGAKLHPKDPVVNTLRTRMRLPKVPDELTAEQHQLDLDMRQAEIEGARMGLDATAAQTEATRAGIGQEDARIARGGKKLESDAKKPAAGKKPKPAAKKRKAT